MSREGSQQNSTPIQNKDDLVSYIERGSKTPDRFRLGLESEKVGVLRETGQAVPFDGPNGIETILRNLADRNGWQTVLDQNRIISLQRGGTAVTLEPGGQLELSSGLHETLDQVCEELDEHFHQVCSVSTPLGVSWLSLGLQPLSALNEMPWVPKSRYGVMKPYYEKRKGLALDMMGLTASIQLNLDFQNEKDARDKVFVGSFLGPVVGAMCANSAVERGQLNGYCTRRLVIWRDTDKDRCGVPPFFVDGTFSFEKYADYALDVPMYFILRDGKYVDHTSMTFRKYLDTKSASDPALLNDWVLHLTTLFPDVRVKDHLEFRTADALEPPLAVALMAMWVGLLYDDESLGTLVEQFKGFTLEDLEEGMKSAAVHGLAGKMKETPLLTLARDAVTLATEGLSRLDRSSNRNDLTYLDPIRDLVEQGLSPAQRLRKYWKNDLNQLIHGSCLNNWYWDYRS